MTQKQTSILGFLTLIAVLAAIWLLFGETAGDDADARGQALFPGLRERVNSIAEIRLRSAQNATTLTRDGGQWRIEEKGGHPADGEKVAKLLAGLLESEIVLEKTANPALYGRIGLGDEAVGVTLLTAEAETVADLHLGKRDYVNREFLTFVRRAGEARSYLADALPEVRPEASTWLTDAILAIARPRIASVTLEHPDGETVAVGRDAPEQDFELLGKAEDESYIGFRPADDLPRMFTALRIDDARPADEIAQNAPLVTARADTFDGLSVVLHLFPTGDETGDAWATLEAHYAAPAVEDLPAAIPDVPADGEAEAVEIERRTVGWAYRLASTTVTNLSRRRADLVEPAQAEEAAETP